MTEASLQALAVALAEEAGAVLHARLGAAAVSSKSSATDVVTEADLAAERLLRERITAARPDDGILGEEDDEHFGTSGLRWVIDPLDGTVGFMYGIPHYSVSVAVEDADGVIAGCVHDPSRAESFAAARGHGAVLGDTPLTAAQDPPLSHLLLATGFAYGAEERAEQARVMARLLPAVRDIRRFGSAALDLAWCAAGRFDAYLERSTKHWDVAAGGLICREAGLTVEPIPAAGPSRPPGLIAAPASVIDELRALELGA